jgi:hypothetical protein
VKIRRARLAAALAPIVLGVGAAVVIAGAPGAPHDPAGALAASVASESAVMVNCANQRQVRPAQFVLACADGNAYLSGLHWSTWRSSAYGTGTWRINDCTPSCAGGTFRSFSALVTLWRPEALPRHRGVRYYSKITIVLPGTHCYTSSGKQTCYPASYTGSLWGESAHGLPISQ